MTNDLNVLNDRITLDEASVIEPTTNTHTYPLPENSLYRKYRMQAKAAAIIKDGIFIYEKSVAKISSVVMAPSRKMGFITRAVDNSRRNNNRTSIKRQVLIIR